MPLVKQHAHHVQNLDLILRSRPRYNDLGIQTQYIHGFIEILRGTPSLVECELRGMPLYREGDPVPELLLHPSLRLLRLGISAEILQHLTLPALEGLLVSTLDIPFTEFISFLTRSSPPLQSLQISTSDPMDRCFRLVPTLTELHLGFQSWNLEDEEAGLSCLTADCLPNLRSLTIVGRFVRDQSEYKNLIVRVLAARRASSHA
ncbi:hypothetical protein B0H13DRAFT_2672430 [Mycena leptocephala]|nr:hypothetical protein B0H13DRAFT_2672430 [Mycena leptocephala]